MIIFNIFLTNVNRQHLSKMCKNENEDQEGKGNANRTQPPTHLSHHSRARKRQQTKTGSGQIPVQTFPIILNMTMAILKIE
jgi:hypothetical protein